MDENKLKRLWWYLGLFAAGAVLLFLLRRLFFLIFPLFPALIFSAAIRKSFRRLSPMKGSAKRILIVLVLLITLLIKWMERRLAKSDRGA